MESKPNLVLIHGAWHGGWCWFKVARILRRAGYTVHTPDLAGLGRDMTPTSKVSLERWTDDISHLIRSRSEKSMLVGHSRAGIVISEVAERYPDSISVLVYLSAFLLRSGQSVIDSPRDLRLAPSVLPVPQQPEFRLYNQCSQVDTELASSLLRPEPRAPNVTPIHITHQNFGKVPKVYIECLRDRMLTLRHQRAMHRAHRCNEIVSLDSDHSPFLSRPKTLATKLKAIANSYSR